MPCQGLIDRAARFHFALEFTQALAAYREGMKVSRVNDDMMVATSDWLAVSQERINQFAEATEDRQWIHVDPERAARESPFKETIAHGFLTLSLLSELGKRAMSVGGMRMGINYGLNRVRFVSPVPAGSRIRALFTLALVDDIRAFCREFR